MRQKVIPVLPTVPGQEGVLPLAEDTFEGSYVAVSKPGKGTVHIVNGRGGSPLYGTGTRITLVVINWLTAYLEGVVRGHQTLKNSNVAFSPFFSIIKNGHKLGKI